MSTPARDRVRSLALGRVGFGVAMLLAPGSVGRGWIGDAADSKAVRGLVRAVGIRDLVVGLATLDAIDEGRPAQRMVTLGVACDAVDATIALTGSDIPGRKRLTSFVTAAAAAAIGASVLSEVDAVA